jgi:hypothetical protein
VTGRLLAGRRVGLLLGGATLCCGALGLLPGEAGPLAARAGLAGLAVVVLASLARRRGHPPARRPLRVEDLASLGRSAQLALVEVDGRRFLVGAGDRPLELLAELTPTSERRPC